ncbi:MAG: TonB-dependent receptor [Geothrix sp.]|uniref:TonB-dependent receptor n=1 Tax=Geothrix sp. TaxID=1962974 RepID=UPI0017EC377B|nr:TonB-dependent receptor [Geothrix sp.]NWJ40985.1 TonB-dependent receptor [Geothrix sp.]WIL21018.1 MAG: TonB-dependent receptor [Geothrix sp.]
MRQSAGLAIATLLLVPGPLVRACGACGCTLNSDWASQGYAVKPGFRFDLRYDYFNQDQLRSGTKSVDRGGLVIPNGMEIQEKTINRNLTATLDYSPDPDWGVTLLVPVFNRYHATLAPGDMDPSFSKGSGLGDVRVLGRYQGFSEDHSFGIQFGVKLATGDTKQTFNAGAQAGELLDRGLQLGTGTTDLLLGCYAFGELAADWGVFGQVLFQKPTGGKDGFKPGDGVNANVGLRYTGHAGFTPHLQLNVRAEGRESGPNADVDNSGATLVYLSPGVTFNVSPRFQVYAFAQVPVAQRVTGLQIEPRWSASLGLHWSF